MNGLFDVPIELCGNGCCPKAEFSSDGSITLREDDQEIVLNPDTLAALVAEAKKRGHLA